MKKSEIGIIGVIIVFSLLVAYFVGSALLGSTTQKGVVVQTMPAISSAVDDPDAKIFYEGAKNPTVEINIGQSSNQQPLTGGQ